MSTASRNLSRIYLRYNGKNVCFEELPPAEQKKVVVEWKVEGIKRANSNFLDIIYAISDGLDEANGRELSLMLAEFLNSVAERFDARRE